MSEPTGHTDTLSIKPYWWTEITWEGAAALTTLSYESRNWENGDGWMRREKLVMCSRCFQPNWVEASCSLQSGRPSWGDTDQLGSSYSCWLIFLLGKCQGVFACTLGYSLLWWWLLSCKCFYCCWLMNSIQPGNLSAKAVWAADSWYLPGWS